jgi:hypothetical protein
MASYRYDKWGVWNDAPDDTDPDRERSLYLGRMETVEKTDEKLPTDFVEIPYTTGSDYSGGSVTVSNYRSIWDDFKDRIPGLYQIYGGHGTYGLVVRRGVLSSDDEACQELREVIEKLEDYCIYNEDDSSIVEMEAEQEAWESWAKSDYRRALEKAEIIPEDSDETINDDMLWETLRLVMDRENVYWINETGNSAYVDIERIARATTTEDIETARLEIASYSREDNS